MRIPDAKELDDNICSAARGMALKQKTYRNCGRRTSERDRQKPIVNCILNKILGAKICCKRYESRCIYGRYRKSDTEFVYGDDQYRYVHDKEPHTCSDAPDSVKYNGKSGKSSRGDIVGIDQKSRSNSVKYCRKGYYQVLKAPSFNSYRFAHILFKYLSLLFLACSRFLQER